MVCLAKKKGLPDSLSALMLMSLLVIWAESFSQASGQAVEPTRPASNLSLQIPQTPFQKQLDAQWRMQFGGRFLEDGMDEATEARFRAQFAGQYTLSPWLKMIGDFDVGLQSGRIQSRDTSARPNSIGLGNAYLQTQLTNDLWIRGGAISQRVLATPFLLSSTPHPGLQFEYKTKNDNHEFAVVWQQLVPSSDNLSIDRNQKEPIPSFASQTFFWIADWSKEIKTRLIGTLFDFNDLPAVVASRSVLYGNSTNGATAEDASFAYDFRGYNLRLSGSYKLAPTMDVFMGSTWHENMAASVGASRAQMVDLGFSFLMNDVVIQPTFKTFFMESDASPASYLPLGLGRANRKGYSTELVVAFKSLGFQIATEYTQAEEIRNNPYQGRFENLEIRLETEYVTF